jgi:hypothetical protein
MIVSPANVFLHGCESVEECATDVLRSLGEGGHFGEVSPKEPTRTMGAKP